VAYFIAVICLFQQPVRFVTLRETASTHGRLASCFRASVFLLIFIALGCQPSLAQKKSSSLGQKLPSPEKVVEKYLKTIGGKKRLAAIRDATFDWTIQLNAQTREHSLLQMETDRELNNRGEVKKETVKTFEVFPIANRAPILRSKLVGVVWIDPADKHPVATVTELKRSFHLSFSIERRDKPAGCSE
jgi:hypothetical protein